MQGIRATVFGASGFIGRNIVRELAARGLRVNAVCRDAEHAKFLKPMGNVGQVTPMRADVTDADAVARAVRGAEVVINLVYRKSCGLGKGVTGRVEPGGRRQLKKK